MHKARPSVMSRRRLTGLAFAPLVLGTVCAGFAGGAPSAFAADDVLCSSLSAPVHQAVNPTSQASMLTPWKSEVLSAAAYGFTTDNGVQFTAALNTTSGLTAVQRLYNSATSDFAWSATSSDVSSMVAKGYKPQKNEFFASASPLSCTVPVHRVMKGSKTRSVTAGDLSTLTAAGWTDMGAMFHVRGTKNASPVNPPSAGNADADADGKFSLAIYPDTQMEVMSGGDYRLSNRNDYVAKQKTVRDIRYVLHSGDLVNWDTASSTNSTDHRQYDYASREMKNLEAAKIPWAAALGNHDTYAVGPNGGSARPGVVTATALRDTKTYNQYFSAARFGNIAGTFEAGKVDNAYRLFDAAGKKWMILNLELWPRTNVVSWAKNVVAANPQRNVIVLTHSYLTGAGTIEQSNGGYGATSPQYLFDNLIKVYPNIKLVFSGHVNTSAVRSDTGVNGNKVLSILTSFHSNTTNQVRFLEIDTTKGSVNTDIYAPWTNFVERGYTASFAGMRWVG